MIKSGQKTPKDLLDILLEVEDESGHKMGNEDIIDLLIVFLFAGQKTTAIAMMWSIIYLTDNPHFMKKAKVGNAYLVLGAHKYPRCISSLILFLLGRTRRNHEGKTPFTETN